MAFLFFIFAFLSLFIKETLGPKSKKGFMTAYICLGLAALLKGPVAILLTLLTLFLYFRITKKGFDRKGSYLRQGILTICLIALPWFIYMAHLHGTEYLKHILLRETVQRLFPSGGSGWLKGLLDFLEGLVDYIPVILYFYLPWIIFVPSGLYKALKSRKENNATMLLLIYAGVIFVFFSLINEKHRHYMLYLTPAVAVFTARFLIDNWRRPWIKRTFVSVFTLSMLVIYFMGIAINRNSYTLDEMFSRIKYKFKETDQFTVASYQIHTHVLEANVNKSVKHMAYNWSNKDEAFRETQNMVNYYFFATYPDKAFCLLSKTDFERFNFAPSVKDTIRVIGKGYVVRKPDVKNIYRSIIKPDRRLFWDSFRREVVFITNKSSL